MYYQRLSVSKKYICEWRGMLKAIKLSARQSVYISEHSIKSSFINFISQLGLNVAAAFPTHLPALLALGPLQFLYFEDEGHSH